MKPATHLIVTNPSRMVAISDLLDGIAPDWRSNLDLKETPARVARFYEEFLSPPVNSWTSFENVQKYDQVIAVTSEFYSICAHHLLPFFGSAAVGYIPADKIVGLSKLARAVEERARRLTTQEAITQETADLIEEKLKPQGIMVVIKARHFCMEMRGVHKPKAETITSAIRGAFRTEPAARAEFMLLAGDIGGKR